MGYINQAAGGNGTCPLSSSSSDEDEWKDEGGTARAFFLSGASKYQLNTSMMEMTYDARGTNLETD
jgi:hypothetical protein